MFHTTKTKIREPKQKIEIQKYVTTKYKMKLYGGRREIL